MQNGVLNENGELIGQIREATRGLYLRNCRAVWNECVSRDYLTNQEYPFSNVKKKKLVTIPVGDTRKDPLPECPADDRIVSGVYRETLS